MNKLLTKAAKLLLGLSLAAGVGVAVGSKRVERADAVDETASANVNSSGGNTSWTLLNGSDEIVDVVASAVTTHASQLRMAANSTLTFTPHSGQSISIKSINFKSNSTTTYMPGSSSTYAVDGGNATSFSANASTEERLILSAAASSSVVVTFGNAVRLTHLDVTYEDTSSGSGTTSVVSLTPSNAGWTTTTGGEEQTGTAVSGVTASCTKGLNGSTELRIYKNQTLTISSSTYAITKIVFSCTASGTTKYGPGCFGEQDGYTYSGSTGTWVGVAASVSFVASLEQVRATSIDVTLDSAAVALNVSPESVVIAPNGTETLTATTAGGSGDVSWSTSDSDVVSISSSTGSSITITGESIGEATITASYSTATDVEIDVVVYELSGSGTQIDPYTPSDVYFLASQLDSGTNNGAIVYASGTVSAFTSFDDTHSSATFSISDGTRTVTAYSIGSSSKVITDSNYVGVNCEVVVSGAIIHHATGGYEIGYASDYNSALVSSNKGTLSTVTASLKSEAHAVGSTLSASDFDVSLTYSLNVSGAITSGFTWTVNGTAGASTELIEGTNTIVVSYGNVDSDSISLVLTLVHANSVEIDTPSTTTLLPGGTVQLSATILPAGYVDSVTWSSSDADVATVSNSGLVTAVAAGQASISVSANNISDSVTITVQAAVKYSKITSAATDLSGKYLIVADGYSVAFDGSLTTLDANNNNVSATFADNSTSVLDTCYVTLAKSGDDYTIQTASGYYIGATANSNSLNSSTTIEYTNSISFDEDGNAVIVGSGGAYFRYNSNANTYRFRYFKSDTYTNQKAVQLYRVDMLESWVGSYMHMNDSDYSGDGTGLCKSAGTYLAAKSALADLGEVYITQFKDGVQTAYSNALARYQKWALACGDTKPFDGTKAISSGLRILSNMVGNNTNTVAIIVIISLVSVTAIGGYFFIKRREEN